MKVAKITLARRPNRALGFIVREVTAGGEMRASRAYAQSELETARRDALEAARRHNCEIEEKL